MTKILRCALLIGLAAALAAASAQDPFLRKASSCAAPWKVHRLADPPSPPVAYGGPAALAVGGIGILARLRKR